MGSKFASAGERVAFKKTERTVHEVQMYLARLYDPAAGVHRVRYAIANILRDRVVNEGAFRVCFEMGDEDRVIQSILRRGLKNPKLRTALEQSHLINLTHWLARFPDLAEAYFARQSRDSERTSF